jgi:hypothetical protein
LIQHSSPVAVDIPAPASAGLRPTIPNGGAFGKPDHSAAANRSTDCDSLDRNGFGNHTVNNVNRMPRSV